MLALIFASCVIHRPLVFIHVSLFEGTNMAPPDVARVDIIVVVLTSSRIIRSVGSQDSQEVRPGAGFKTAYFVKEKLGGLP